VREGFAIATYLLNDWPIRRFCIVLLSLQLAYVGLVLSQSIVTNLGIVRDFIGILILVLVPGFSMLRIMKMHNLEPGKTVLYAVGLSLSFVMAVGLFASVALPLIDLQRPMTSGLFLLSFNIGLLLLLLLAYVRDRDFEPVPNHSRPFGGISLTLLISLFLLLLGVLGTSIANALGGNLIQMVFILCISVFPVIVVMWRDPRGLNSTTIFLLSLALTYHVSLFSPYITGSDIFGEYYFANSTLVNGYWDFSVRNPITSSLSITILPAAFQLVSNIDVSLYFKVIAPIFLSLVPTGLIFLYQKALGGIMTKKEMFFAVFFSISIWQFYGMMPGVVRQQLGELYYVMLLMLLMERGDGRTRSSTPIILIFSAALIVSHYTMADLFLFFLLFTLVFIRLFGKAGRRGAPELSLNYIALFMVLCFSWSMFTGQGGVFFNMSNMIPGILSGFSSLFSPDTNAVVGAVTSSSASIFHDVFRLINYAIIFLLLIEVIRVLRGTRSGALSPTLFYYSVSLSNYIFLLLVFLVPFLGFKLGFDRGFQIAILVLAPFLVLAFKDLAYQLSSLFKISAKGKAIMGRVSTLALALFLSMMLLFGSGLVYAVMDDPVPTSVPLSVGLDVQQIENENGTAQALLKAQTVTTAEITAAIWLNSYRENGVEIHAGSNCGELNSYGMLVGSIKLLENDNLSTIKGYFYYGSLGKIFGIQIIKPGWQAGSVSNISSFDVMNSGAEFNRIYSGSMSDIYSTVRA